MVRNPFVLTDERNLIYGDGLASFERVSRKPYGSNHERVNRRDDSPVLVLISNLLT